MRVCVCLRVLWCLQLLMSEVGHAYFFQSGDRHDGKRGLSYCFASSCYILGSVGVGVVHPGKVQSPDQQLSTSTSAVRKSTSRCFNTNLPARSSFMSTGLPPTMPLCHCILSWKASCKTERRGLFCLCSVFDYTQKPEPENP